MRDSRECRDERKTRSIRDHPEPALAQGCTEVRLAYDRRRRARPISVVELEPEGDVERETDRGPDAQPKQQRRPRGPRHIRHGESRGPTRHQLASMRTIRHLRPCTKVYLPNQMRLSIAGCCSNSRASCAMQGLSVMSILSGVIAMHPSSSTARSLPTGAFMAPGV